MAGNLAVGLDVGTSKVCAVAAELNDRGVNILGLGEAPSRGLRKGMVINMDATIDSIKKAVREAERSAGIRIKSVTAGISGAHIKGLDSFGAIGVRRREVRPADMDRAIESAKAVYIPLDREVLHVIPMDFILDGQEGIADPVGMSGVRLEAKVHIITGVASSIQNLVKCCEKAGVDVSDIVFGPVASAAAALSRDEMECGVLLADIGGGTTDMVFIRDGAVRYSSVLGVGGAHVTNDIAVGLRINVHEAEKLKRSCGAAYAGIVNGKEEVQINQTGGNTKTMPAQYISEIIQPRCEEMIGMMKEEVKACCGYELATCGLVLTGGASLLHGFDKMTESLLGLPVRIGRPVNVRGQMAAVANPAYSSCAGLVAYGYESSPARVNHPDIFADIVAGIKGWLKGAFRNKVHIQ
ncbi:MAG: cell division protein FtsA [Nitrospirota bacterium]|nr:cell division protein FtsA [Nitrospirota bacterium]